MAIITVLTLFTLPFGASATDNAEWFSAWSTEMTASTSAQAVSSIGGFPSSSTYALKGKTARIFIKPEGSGTQIRLTLSNEFGYSALGIKSITVSKQVGLSAGVSTPVKYAYYNKKSNFSIPAGGVIVTDPVSINVKEGDTLAVSIHFQSEPGTIALSGGETWVNFKASASQTTSADLVVSKLFGGFEFPVNLCSDTANGHYDIIPTLCGVEIFGQKPVTEPKYFDEATGNRTYSIELPIDGGYTMQYQVFPADDGRLMIVVGPAVAVPLDEFVDGPLFYNTADADRTYTIVLYSGESYNMQYNVFEENGVLMINIGNHVAVPLADYVDGPLFYNTADADRTYTIVLYSGESYTMQYNVFEQNGVLMINIGNHVAVPLFEYIENQ